MRLVAILPFLLPAPRRKHLHFERVWTHDDSVLSHRRGFDAAQDVREHFGEVEAEKLARLAAAGRRVRIDLRAGAVSESP